MTRDEQQELIVKDMQTIGRVMLLWGTSTGKGFTGVKVVNALRPERVLLMVAETKHKNNWREEFVKAGCEEFFDFHVTAECYESLHKYEGTHWDLIIYDEFHHLGSVARMASMMTVTADRVMCLSATMNDYTLISRLNARYGKFKMSRISLQTAIDRGYLPEPQVYVHHLKLDNIHRTQTIVEKWGKSKHFMRYECTYEERWNYLKLKKTMKDAMLTIHCTPHQKYLYLEEKMQYWKDLFMKTAQEWAKVKWLRMGSDRKKFLGEQKTAAVMNLLGKLESEDLRYICFCTSIEQTELFGKDYAIHSKVDCTDARLADFNDGVINKLFCVNMLQEGQNLKNIDAGIIVQLDGKDRALWQKTGRAMRAEHPQQHIFVFDNTQDIKYLEALINGLDSRYITHIY